MDFSRRTAWPRAPNPLAEKLELLRLTDRTWIDLTESNPTRCGFQYPTKEISAALCDAPVDSYQPEPRGLPEAREAIARYLRAKGAQVSASQVVLCSGTSEAYAFLFKLLCDPGDNVLVPKPGYPLFDYLVGLESAQTRPYSLSWSESWAVDPRAVDDASDARTRAVLVVSPGNPTGNFLKGSEFDALDQLCGSKGWALIVDEVFSDYGWAEDPRQLQTVLTRQPHALVFVLSGLSKVAGLPQMKVSWLVASGDASATEEALARLELVADSYLSVNGPAQQALPKLLELAPGFQQQLRARVAQNRAMLLSLGSSASRWRVLPGEGGWSAVLQLLGRREEEGTCLALLDQGVLVHPGYFFDFPQKGYLVISLIPPPEFFSQGVRRMASLLEQG